MADEITDRLKDMSVSATEILKDIATPRYAQMGTIGKDFPFYRYSLSTSTISYGPRYYPLFIVKPPRLVMDKWLELAGKRFPVIPFDSEFISEKKKVIQTVRDRFLSSSPNRWGPHFALRVLPRSMYRTIFLKTVTEDPETQIRTRFLHFVYRSNSRSLKNERFVCVQPFEMKILEFVVDESEPGILFLLVIDYFNLHRFFARRISIHCFLMSRDSQDFYMKKSIKNRKRKFETLYPEKIERSLESKKVCRRAKQIN